MAGPPDWATFTTPTGQVRKVILPRGATKYPNAEARAKLIEAFKLGGTPELAALYAGIDIDTLRYWLEQGALSGRGNMYEIAKLVNLARGEAGVINLKQIDKAAKRGAWQASVWRLGKIFPESYGDKMTLRHVGAGNGPIQIEQRTTVEIHATLEHKLGLPPEAIAAIGRQVAMMLTQQTRAQMAAGGAGAAGQVVDIQAEP